MSKFKEYLEKQGIDSRRVLTASKKIEALRPEDRAIRLVRRLSKKEENSNKKPETKKPRSGRPVASPTLARALKGEALSGAAKNRLLRAVNVVLKLRSKPEATLVDLF